MHFFFLLFFATFLQIPLLAGIHSAPIVIKGQNIRNTTGFKIENYRLFRTGSNGKAVPIPFQIDEINSLGDYVLDKGSDITKFTGNGRFDTQDELSFMGDDVGPQIFPKDWGNFKPDVLYEIKLNYQGGNLNPMPEPGAVYLGVYFGKAPQYSQKNYVTFNLRDAEILTSRYRYQFDNKNYLVVRGVNMLKQEGAPPTSVELPILDSSTFYLLADLKYFFTIELNHKSVNSEIEAFKLGPIRAIVRVSFFYRILKMNFELGMFTEVSFFSNAVFLPAIMYNPLEGPKSLNRGSGFYYGFALHDNPADLKFETNMPSYEKKSFFDFMKTKPQMEPTYWASATGKDRMMYFEIVPSKDMKDAGGIPSIYKEDISGTGLSKRPTNKALGLGESPVNLGLFFDLTKFNKGEHLVSFRLFFENKFDQNLLDRFRNLPLWQVYSQRL